MQLQNWLLMKEKSEVKGRIENMPDTTGYTHYSMHRIQWNPFKLNPDFRTPL